MTKKHAFLMGAIVVGLVLGLTLAFTFRGDFGTTLVLLALVGCVGIPLALVGGLTFVVARYVYHKRMPWIGLIALAVAGIASIPGFLTPLGIVLQHNDVIRARGYCESLIPLIEAYRAEHGRYPSRLDDHVPSERSVPRLLENETFYSSDGSAFWFQFEVLDGFLPTIYTYSSEDDKWEEYD